MRNRRNFSLWVVTALVVVTLPLGALGSEHITPISKVQGSGFTTPMVGQVVTIEGIVVGAFQGDAFGDPQLRGFYVQEEDEDQDGNDETSEGIFVFHTFTRVAVGDKVQVTGTAGEFSGQTQLSSATVTISSSGNPLPTLTEVSLPVPSSGFLERYEGMLVTFPEDLYISEYFNFDRFGEIVLTTDRQFQGTQVAEPGEAALAVTAANLLARITLDDGRNTQNPDPAIHPNGEEFTLTNTFRGGDILRDVTGILGQGFGIYRIQPTQGATHIVDNPRPSKPDPIAGDIRVASFNVLNFFTTIDDGSNNCGPTGDLNCRGADTEEEYERQLAKLLAGIIDLDADIVGIQEIENDIHEDNGSRPHDAVLTLVDELNAVEGPGTWAWVGPLNHYNDYPVRNEIIYRTGRVTPVGPPQTIAHDAFDSTRPGDIEPLGRPPVAQTFKPNLAQASSQPFAVVVNHFKSKGSSCASIGDPDLGDGQSNCNLTRVAQAHALLDFVAELEMTSSGVLVIGDLNSYAQEDPIGILLDGGLTDLIDLYVGHANAYTFVFDGQLGVLDHALATRSILNRVTGLTLFRINADEPDILDYDMTFKLPAQAALYEPLSYRSSDHDPVIIGLTFARSPR